MFILIIVQTPNGVLINLRMHEDDRFRRPSRVGSRTPFCTLRKNPVLIAIFLYIFGER